MIVRSSRRLLTVSVLGACLLLAACGVAVGTPAPSGTGAATSSGLTRRTPAAVADEVATPTPGDWSSAQITAAEAAGTLAPADALLYRLYAAYAPDQLPPAYSAARNPALAVNTPASGGLTRKTATHPTDNTAVFAQLHRTWAQLPAAVRDQARPFLQRPTLSQSFWYPASDTVPAANLPAAATNPFASVDVAHTPIRLWYTKRGGDTTKQQATKLAAEIDSSGMWNKESQVMLGHTPCSDAALPDNGGDGRLDVYLVKPGGKVHHADGGNGSDTLDKGYLGLTIPQENDSGCPSSDFIIIDNTQEWDGLRTTMAHELFHAFQDSFAAVADGADWWAEATATWAEDLVYPTVNSEQDELVEGGWADNHGPLGPLDLFDDGGLEQYGAYIWPYYLTHRPGGDPTLIGQLYQAAQNKRPIDVLHDRPDWEARFKEFALWNWNQDPVQIYRDQGKPIAPLTQSPIAMGYRGAIAVGQAPAANRISLRHASIIYYQLTTVNDGANGANFAHQLKFDLSELHGQTGLGVQAILTVGDPAHPTRRYVEDWSTQNTRVFCRDRAAEDVTGVVLVVTNSAVGRGNNLDGHITVEASGTACH